MVAPSNRRRNLSPQRVMRHDREGAATARTRPREAARGAVRIRRQPQLQSMDVVAPQPNRMRGLVMECVLREPMRPSRREVISEKVGYKPTQQWGQIWLHRQSVFTGSINDRLVIECISNVHGVISRVYRILILSFPYTLRTNNVKWSGFL